jgi:hypothetical protein
MIEYNFCLTPEELRSAGWFYYPAGAGYKNQPALRKRYKKEAEAVIVKMS